MDNLSSINRDHHNKPQLAVGDFVMEEDNLYTI